MQTGLYQDKDSNSIMRAFISSFVAEEFFVTTIRTCLFPAKFNAGFLSDKNTAIEFIKGFFTDLSKKCDQLNIPNTKVIKGNISLATTILNIRESGATIIDYDNVFQHVPNLNLAQQKLIQRSIDNKLDDVSGFRQSTETLMSEIKAFQEICSIEGTLSSNDFWLAYATKPDVSVFEAIKLWRDNTINNYNELSKLQTAHNLDTERDFYVISDEKSVNDLAGSFVDYISTGYSFYKTGFELFDNNIEGFESASVHLVSAPSNHGKSIFLINLVNTIIQCNHADFEKGDAILFLTLEDKNNCPY